MSKTAILLPVGLACLECGCPSCSGKPWIEVEDDNQHKLLPLLVGAKIVSFQREVSSGENWEQGSNTISIALDNGIEVTIDSWGHDSWGATMTMARKA